MIFALKGADQRKFLRPQLDPFVRMHKELYQLLILLVLVLTLDYSVNKCQISQLRQQPLWGVELQAMEGKLQA